MIAFYAWTDTLLLNAYRIRMGDYASEEADLIILNLPRVSRSVVKEIEETGVFSRIVRIEDVHQGKRTPVQKVLKLFSGERYAQAVDSQLAAIADRTYDTLFTGGLWADSLFVYRFMAQRNANLRIALMEEGVVNYGGIRTALWCDAINRRRDFLFRHFFFAGIYQKGCAALSMLYLTEPGACLDAGRLEVRRIRCDAPGYRALAGRLGDEACIGQYRRRRAVFFMQPEPEEDARITQRIVGEMVSRFGAQQVIVRMHPDTRSAEELQKACPGVYIDPCAIPFEAIADRIDWSDKVLAARASSCMFLPRFAYGQQPQLYYVYQLFENGDRSLIGPMVERIRSLYDQADRVHLPRSLSELQQMLTAHADAGE